MIIIGSGAVMLELHDVSKEFRDGLLGRSKHLVLEEVSLDIERGRFMGLVGESGSGKTTIARIALRLLDASSGTISLDGVDITKLDQKALGPVRRRMQIIFQHPEGALDPQYRLKESIREALFKAGTPRFRLTERTDEMCELVNLPTDLLDRYPHQVSGGEVQRIALARVLSFEPDYLFLDEPTSMLDLSVQAHIMNLIRTMAHRKNMGVVVISHDLDLVKSICGVTAVLHRGRLVASGATEEVLSYPESDVVRRLVDAWALQSRYIEAFKRPYRSWPRNTDSESRMLSRSEAATVSDCRAR